MRSESRFLRTFGAGTFPVMTFSSAKISDQGDGMYAVTGSLTVKDKGYDFTLPLKFAGMKEHPAQKGTDVAGFNGSFVVDRLVLGVGSGKFYDMGIVGKDVEVFVSLELLSTSWTSTHPNQQNNYHMGKA